MSNIEIKPLQASHRDAVREMISTAFAQDDPLARSQGIDAKAFGELIDLLYPEFLASQLSTIAWDSALRRLAAVVLTDRFSDSDEGSNAIAAIIDSARRRYLSELPPGEHRLAHIHFIASSSDYRRQGLVQRAVEASLHRAAELGFDRILVEASGNRSRRLLQEHLGFEARVRIGYADFDWQGSRPFEDIAEHGGLCLMEYRP